MTHLPSLAAVLALLLLLPTGAAGQGAPPPEALPPEAAPSAPAASRVLPLGADWARAARGRSRRAARPPRRNRLVLMEDLHGE
jgi:hypothetical protein